MASLLAQIVLWILVFNGRSSAELHPVLQIEPINGFNNDSSTADPELRQYTCGSTSSVFVAKGYQGRFASPNYPSSYSGNSDCLWILTTSTDAHFTLICDPLSISCTGDYLLYSLTGSSTFSDASQPVCGTGRLQVTAKANAIAVTFHSSSYTMGGGFSCVAQALPLSTPVPATTIATTTTAPNPSPTCQCGIKGQNRVVGGQPAGVTEWPWQALLTDNRGSSFWQGQQYCGASLISPDWVITAAHCTYGKVAASINVIVGQYNSNYTANWASTAQVRGVAQIIQHPNFNRLTVDHDISLLRLSSPVTFSAAVRPICLPTRFVNFNFNNQVGVVTGWGTTSFGGPVSQNLLEVSLPILSTSSCRLYPNISSRITDNMFCTYADNKDACQGDSGGPLNWVDPQTGLTYLIGITSWGIGCARPNIPGVYTKVTNYLSWIQRYTGTLCSV